MSYGISVLTTEGFSDLSDFASARLINVISVTTPSGTASGPSGFASNPLFFVKIEEGLGVEVSYNSSNNQFSWSPGPLTPQTVSFFILCFRG